MFADASFSEDDPIVTEHLRALLAEDDEPEEGGFTIDEIRAEYGLNKEAIIVADPAPLML